MITVHGHSVFVEADLREDVISEIKKNHRILNCPHCGGSLTKSCSLGIPVSAFMLVHNRLGPNPNDGADGGVCTSCNVVWVIYMRNFTDESGDGGSIFPGHIIFLTGFSNCVHRYPALKEELIVHSKGGEYSCLGQPCR